MLFHLHKMWGHWAWRVSLKYYMHPKTLVLAIFFFGACLVVWTWSCLNSTKEIAKKNSFFLKKQSKGQLQKIIHDMNLNPTLPPRPVVMRFDTGTRRMDDLPDELHGEPGVEIAFDLDLQWRPWNSWKTPGGWKISCFFETKTCWQGAMGNYQVNVQYQSATSYFVWFVASSGFLLKAIQLLKHFLKSFAGNVSRKTRVSASLLQTNSTSLNRRNELYDLQRCQQLKV